MSLDLIKVQVFCCYTTSDREQMCNFSRLLADKAILSAANIWYDARIHPDLEWEKEIKWRLSCADIVLIFTSPKFFQSKVCTQDELPVIRRRLAGEEERLLTSESVKVIQLVEHDDSEVVGGLPNWGRGVDLRKLEPDDPSFQELQRWLKLAICKAFTQRLNEGTLSQDDFALLSEDHGVNVVRNRKLWAVVGVSLGAVGGAAATIAIEWLDWDIVETQIAFFAIVSFISYATLPVVQVVRNTSGDDLKIIVFLVAGILVVPVGFAGAALGAIAGLFVGFIAYLAGWQYRMDMPVGIAVGCVVGSWPWLTNPPNLGKELKVFLDADYEPPAVDPEGEGGLESIPYEREVAIADEDSVSANDSPPVDLPDFFEPPKPIVSPDQVRVDLSIVAATEGDVDGLRAALDAEEVNDLFNLRFLIADATDESHDWKPVFANNGQCVVLMTRELATHSLLESLQNYVKECSSRVSLVRIEKNVPADAPLMYIQALPEQIPTRGWPIEASAWRSVARTLRARTVAPFLRRLNRLHLERLPKPEDSFEELRFLRRYGGAHARGSFIEPRHDFAAFDFQYVVWYWSARSLASWGLGAGIASLCFQSTAPWGLAAFLAYLLLRDTIHYSCLRSWCTRISVFEFFVGLDHTIRRRPVLIWFGRLFLRVIATLVVAILVVGPLGKHDVVLEGVVIGLVSYLVTRYRVPSLVIPRSIPTHRDKYITRSGLTWTIEFPVENFPELLKATFGRNRPHEPRMIESYAFKLRISIAGVARALLESLVVVFLGMVIFLALTSFLVSRAFMPGALMLASTVASLLVTILGGLPKFHGKVWPWIQGVYRRMTHNFEILVGIPLFVAVVTALLTSADFYLLFLGVATLVTFVFRLLYHAMRYY